MHTSRSPQEPDRTSFRTVAGLAAPARNRTPAHTALPAAALAAAAEAAGVTRAPGAPLTPVVLSVRPSGAPVRASAGELELSSLGELDTGAARHDATFLVNETASGTEVHLVHDVARFDEAAAQALLDGFLHVLAEGSAAPDRACSEITPAVPPRLESPPRTSGEREPVAPATVIEEFLAATWGRLLPAQDVMASDSLFDLGGTSLTAIRTAREIRDALGVEVAVHTIFELPVLSDLAAEVERRALAALDGQEEGTA